MFIAITVTKTVKLRELLDKKGTVNLQHLHLTEGKLIIRLFSTLSYFPVSAALRHQREDVNRRERNIQKDREGVAHRAGVPNDYINVSDLL